MSSNVADQSKRNPQVDAYLSAAAQWQRELKMLRAILLGCPLTEELKWGKPCYAFQGGNVAIILPMKESCALLFCKGALLKDDHGLLIKPGPHTQAARQMRFTHAREIVARKDILKGYLHQAIDVEKRGLEVACQKTTDFLFPDELRNRLAAAPSLKTAFSALTPGRQRGYLIYFSGAKQAETRAARVEKCVSRILEGKGLNDR